MAKKEKKKDKKNKTVFRIILSLIAIAALSVGGIIWFQYLGVVQRGALPFGIGGIANRVSDTAPLDPDDQLLLERERILKREEAVERQQGDIDRRERGALFQEEQLRAREEELLAFEAEINEREKNLISEQNRYENEREILIENVRQLTAMRPAEAAAILVEYDDQLLVDTFQVAEEVADEAGEVSLVPLWLSLLPPDRASAVQRKTVIKYGS